MIRHRFAAPATTEATSPARSIRAGQYDHHIIAQLAHLDDLTVRTLVSLIERARTANHHNTARRHLESWCRRQAGVTGTPLAVLLALITYTDDRGANAAPSIADLAAHTGRSISTITRALRTLIRTGHITSDTKTAHHGRNRYTIHISDNQPANNTHTQTAAQQVR